MYLIFAHTSISCQAQVLVTPKTNETRPPLSCPGAPGQDRGGRVGTAEYEFRAALFAHLPGKLACPITFTLDEHGRTMVEQPIQRCRCRRRVTEDRSPFSWHFITGHNDAFLFVACRYQLKKQLPLQRCERDVPQLIEDEQFGLVNIPYFFIKCTCVVSFFHLLHQPGHGIETNRKASLQSKLSQRYAQVCLSDSGWTNQDHVFTTDHPSERSKPAYPARVYRWLE